MGSKYKDVQNGRIQLGSKTRKLTNDTDRINKFCIRINWISRVQKPETAEHASKDVGRLDLSSLLNTGW